MDRDTPYVFDVPLGVVSNISLNAIVFENLVNASFHIFLDV
jgi:hypothetical protein